LEDEVFIIAHVHQHVVSELQQGARTGTVFVIIAVLLNLVMLGISSGVATLRTERQRRCWGCS